MDVVDANWRGIGVIPGSGFNLKDEHAALDARWGEIVAQLG